MLTGPSKSDLPPVLCAIALMLVLPSFAFGQSVEDFYKGRQINLIIGGGAGGGYDVYYRTLARHMGRHIPGNPSFIAKNQPAADRKSTRLNSSH